MNQNNQQQPPVQVHIHGRPSLKQIISILFLTPSGIPLLNRFKLFKPLGAFLFFALLAAGILSIKEGQQLKPKAEEIVQYISQQLDSVSVNDATFRMKFKDPIPEPTQLNNWSIILADEDETFEKKNLKHLTVNRGIWLKEGYLCHWEKIASSWPFSDNASIQEHIWIKDGKQQLWSSALSPTRKAVFTQTDKIRDFLNRRFKQYAFRQYLIGMTISNMFSALFNVVLLAYFLPLLFRSSVANLPYSQRFSLYCYMAIPALLIAFVYAFAIPVATGFTFNNLFALALAIYSAIALRATHKRFSTTTEE